MLCVNPNELVEFLNVSISLVTPIDQLLNVICQLVS
jgi:hypothetical protein